MIGFDNTIKTIKALRNDLDSFINILKESDKNPELLLSEYVLPSESDRMYVLTRLMVEFGEEGFNAFISEYFDKILQTLTLKIPISEIMLTPAYFEDEYVILGIIEDTPKMVINTFNKTISYLPDENFNKIYADMDACNELIYTLEQQLEMVTADSDKITFNKKKHEANIKSQAAAIVAQLGIEKQNLANVKDTLAEYQHYADGLHETLSKYASRLVNYYGYVILKTEDSE